MKKYIFLSKEGETYAPNGELIHNLQVIGIVEDAANKDEALKVLLKDNSWIWDSGFNVAEFVCFEIL
jgi:hypothetical protein